MEEEQRQRSITYKTLACGIPVAFDAYFPAIASSSNDLIPLPAVVYFHGGGMTVGNRKSWFPVWLRDRVLSSGYIFISADYQLMPPATGHDIVEDIQDLLSYLGTENLLYESEIYRIKPDAIAVAGSSAGGLCAYLAAIHCRSPKPKAIVSIYGMGGDFFTPHYLQPKNEIFFRGRELLDRADFQEYLYPLSKELHPITDSPLAYHPQTYKIPGFPANPRMLLARLYLQLGIFLDYYTELGLSGKLRAIMGSPNVSVEAIERCIPDLHRRLFPQLNGSPSWPPTLLLHGTADSAVPIEESRHLAKLLASHDVPVQLLEFEGKEHSFDYEAGAEGIWKDRFDDVMAFISTWIH